MNALTRFARASSLAALGLLAGLTSTGRGADAPAVRTIPDLKVETYTLPNGLNVFDVV